MRGTAVRRRRPSSAGGEATSAPLHRHLSGPDDLRRGSIRRGPNGRTGNLLYGRWWLRRRPNIPSAKRH